MTLCIQSSRSFVDCYHFQTGCFVGRICTDKRVAKSICNSRASCFFCDLAAQIVSLATSWYLSTDFLGLPHFVQPPMLQCCKPVSHLRCKLHCFLFLEFLEIQRRNAVLPFLLASQTFGVATSNWWLQSAPGYVRQFIILFSIIAQLTFSLPDSGCRHQERSSYIAALDAVWMWCWPEPIRASSRSLLAAHQLHSFLLSHTAQLQMT